MGSFMIRRVFDVLSISLMTALLFNVDGVCGKPITRVTRNTERNCNAFEDYIVILTYDRTKVLTVLPRGQGLELRNVTEKITLSNLFIKTSGLYPTFTAYAKQRKLSVDDEGKLTITNNASTFYAIHANFTRKNLTFEYYLRALTNGTKCGEGDYIASPYKHVEPHKLTSTHAACAHEPLAAGVDGLDWNEYIFFLEEVNSSRHLSEELTQLCCK
ncbi:uncharacterized protein LOC134188076 [Corticium candelabrum]|uniref:uncharacterized protein LOC134188076 n=1 Tax=Corticium candelabrum TaxID=121492 RepID=UPI002E264530|nr:uncharacterized protein LOC134188076 [Corticium candelabrum]XP_062512244.1 uncharacterized protein LOC134188076 [Corticium candelabrum]XP_062512245.1 uncharacterized protein LOC134188076 [Corticium candelabrum]XP_062512246.1 uncharacterized protein LOC134188076 [Corticium candelabrum]XP_062512247.1 uncharacterized protein LOC134188076 [Corticium candelabrum]XP_062512248.1 uncharacterized protein LOC134188076 [Corticium candelabrum]